MEKVNFKTYLNAKNEVLFGREFKEYSTLSNGMIHKEYVTEDGHNFYELTNTETGKTEFWSTKYAESRIYEEIDQPKEVKSDILGIDAYQVNENTFEIRLVNGKVIIVKQKVEYNGSVWEYNVNGQYFNDFLSAHGYIRRLIAEKLTGNRIIYHTKRSIPDICGFEGSACRHPGKCNTMLCSDCPIAEQFFADRDGVTLVYGVK